MNEVTFLWANDGWCYIPEIKQRRKYLLSNEGAVEILMQLWPYAIPKIEHTEHVTQKVLQEKPLILQEQVGDSSELYEESIRVQTENKNKKNY